jgi:hypothetical protein
LEGGYCILFAGVDFLRHKSKMTPRMPTFPLLAWDGG